MNNYYSLIMSTKFLQELIQETRHINHSLNYTYYENSIKTASVSSISLFGNTETDKSVKYDLVFTRIIKCDKKNRWCISSQFF